jgi:2-methylisocitrate lyase-like PEP mutase family enzyme
MATVTLPSGNTAEIMEVDELTAGVKLAVQRAVSMTMTGGKMVLSLALNEEMKIAALCKLVKSWSFPVMVNEKAFESMAIKDYNALADAVKDHMELLRATPDKSGSTED